ncbi:MAG: VOC family protein [Ferrovibrio sp.]|uniref:VOC family protein n=1 Tax=Ferrovibrio sp. TaxID=1917215 RepID=UPI00262818FB|nr:VOC family protein [Ferrovibrio sp.]MCW0236627.1 VOC family protein [Ferrovibrio sp.]
MAHRITGLDHTVLAVTDLEAARINWQKLGFTLTPRGRHIGWATGNYCIMFSCTYHELLGVAEPGGYTAGLEEALQVRGEGVHKVALGIDDAAAAVAELRASGLNPSAPQDLKRELQLPEGTVLPAFSLVHLPPEATPQLSMFLCQHLTPELLRRPGWLVHPNGAEQISSVIVVTDNPPVLELPYETLVGAGNAVRTDRMVAVRTGSETILFVTPDDLDTLFPDIDHPARPTPYVAGLRFRVHNTEAAAAYFKAAGIEHARSLDGTVLVPASAANGCFLEFSSRA